MIVPRTSLEISLNIYLFSFSCVLLDYVGKTTPSDDIMELRIFLESSARVLPFSIGCDRERGDLLPVWRLPYFGVSGHIPDYLYLIKRVRHTLYKKENNKRSQNQANYSEGEDLTDRRKYGHWFWLYFGFRTSSENTSLKTVLLYSLKKRKPLTNNISTEFVIIVCSSTVVAFY